jgi:hypothetical protein
LKLSILKVVVTISGEDLYLEYDIVSDENGEFTVTFNPSQTGTGSIVVKHPSLSSYAYMEFEVIGTTSPFKNIYNLGMEITPSSSSTPVFSFIMGESNTSSNVLVLTNLGQNSLTNVTGIATVLDSSDLSVTVTSNTTLLFNQSYYITLTIQANGPISLSTVILQFTSTEGATATTTIYVSVSDLKPLLVGKSLVDGKFPSGEQTVYEYIITNEGSASSGILSVTLPYSDYITLLSSNTIPSLMPGESYSLYFLVTPPTVTKRDTTAPVDVTHMIVSSEAVSLTAEIHVASATTDVAIVLIQVGDENGMA